MKHSPIPGDEAAPCVLGYLVGGAGVVQNDVKKHTVREIGALGLCTLASGDSLFCLLHFLLVFLNLWRLLRKCAF